MMATIGKSSRQISSSVNKTHQTLIQSKQTTLFQNWSSGQNVHQNQDRQTEMDDQFDEETLLAACEEWEMEESANSSASTPCPPQATPLEDLPGFDVSAGNIYIYPINYPLRDYQFNIVSQALFKNTMVTLPTGLGKTFIAAVVMYNFYRWYPCGKIVFMAPTKPLVFQQIEACFNIMGIPQADMAEMTGNMHPPERKKSWQHQRVFFLTPQVMTNDLSRRACPANDVKCLVVDEAHKALGNHAYCQVVRELSKYTNQFRVLALSATPGGDIKAVNEVLSNLLISHVEIRSEDSIDIRQYVHERKVEKIVVPIGEELKQVKQQYLQILSVFVNRLVRCRVLFCSNPETLTKFQILKSRDAFRQDPPPEITAARRGPVEGDFAICMSLYHGFELLLQHGQRSLYSFLLGIVDGSKGNQRTRSELMRNSDFSNLIDMLEGKYGSSMQHLNASHNASHNASFNSSGLFSSLRATGSKVVGGCKEEEEYIPSHPKMVKLKEVVLEHFNKITSDSNLPGTSSSKAAPASTRVMIFAQYRDSVLEITDMLNHHRPIIRCMSFIGQASTGKNTKGFSQKEQLRVVHEFKNGGYNTLVSTCVGEEGLDIGDVDLIVCFDAHKSPIRLVQRMGRTGRKRQGRIVMLVTEGKEAAIYDRSQYSKKGIHRALQGNSKSLHLFPCSPRMVPRGLYPVAHKMNIMVGEYQSKHKTKTSAAATASSSATSSKRKSSMGGDITRFLQGTKPDPAEDVFLTYEELAFWNLHYKVDQKEQFKAPQRSKFLSLNKNAVEESCLPDDRELSLNSYAEWQTNKQPTHKVSHSKRCSTFVEMMEFFEIQSHTEDEDIYGAEMALYLDERDVIRPKNKDKRGKEGILRYCSQEAKKHDVVTDGGDDNQKEVTNKPKKGGKGKKKASKVKSSSDDDDLPVVDLCSEASEKQDNNSERIGKDQSTKGKKHKRISDDGSSSDGKVRKSRKKSKSPENDSRAKRKSIPLPSDSDGDDFECDTEKRSVTPPRLLAEDQPVLHAVADQATEPDQSASEDEAMDTASDADVSELPLEPCAAPASSPSKTPQEGNKSDTSLNTSDIFLSCSQVFKAPALPPTLGITTKGRTPSESASGDDDLMPPPPPSLSGLDMLDDIDLSFNASQISREDSWQKTSGKKVSHKHRGGAVPDTPDITASSGINESENMKFMPKEKEENTRILHNNKTVVTSRTVSPSRHGDIDGIEFDDLIPSSDEVRTKDQVNLNKNSVLYTQVIDNVHPNKEATSGASEFFPRSPVLGKHVHVQDKGIQNSLLVQDKENRPYDEEETKNISDELIDAWDNFEGDLFDDDFDNLVLDKDQRSNITTKPLGHTTQSAQDTGRKLDARNVMNNKSDVIDFEGLEQIAKSKISTSSHNIKSCVNSLSSIKETEAKQTTALTRNVVANVDTEEKRKSAVTCNLKSDLQQFQSQPDCTSLSDNEVKQTQQPKFDLDFDFGDFFDMDEDALEEIGIVPPSPQFSQKRSGFMAMSQASQASQSCFKPEVAAAPSKPRFNENEKQDIKPESHAYPQKEIVSCNLNHGKPLAKVDTGPSKTDNRTSTMNRFKRKLMQFENPKLKEMPIQENFSKEQESNAQIFIESKKVSLDEVEMVRQPPAASTPVISDACRNAAKGRGSTVSPIRQSRLGVPKDEGTPTIGLLKSQPKVNRRSRLSTRRNTEEAPKQNVVSFVSDQSSRHAALPGKRKSSPLIAEGHFEDTSVSNPLKKPKTSFDQDSILLPGGNEEKRKKPLEDRGLTGMNDKDGLAFLLEDIDWEESLVVNDTPIKSGNKNDGSDTKRDSEDTSKLKTGTTVDDINEESDDSEGIIGRVSKKKRAVALVSPETPSTFKTPLRSRLAVTPLSFKPKSVHVLSGDESDESVIIQPKKRKAKKILDMSTSIMIHEGDEDDDFEDHVKVNIINGPKGTSKEHGRDDIPLRQRLEMKQKSKKARKSSRHHHSGKHFLDEEVEVSEDEECSSDEDGSDLDEDLEGFINNATQCSQTTTCPREMHAIYMKSVRSPLAGGAGLNRYKMVHRHSPDINVFSQVPQQDASYMEDSFVVQGDEEDDDGEGISLVAMDNTINLDNILDGGSRRSGRRLRNRGGESKAARILRAGRAAVLKSDSSPSDIEEVEEEEDDLMDWEKDFVEKRTVKQKKNHKSAPLGKKRLPRDYRTLEKATVNSKAKSSEPQNSAWLKKPTISSQPFEVKDQSVKEVREKEKSPLKTSYALMNSVRIRDGAVLPDRPISKPCTFVAPQPAATHTSSAAVSPKTLAQREKEERLRLQKQKQTEFLQKMQQRRAQNTSQVSNIDPVNRAATSLRNQISKVNMEHRSSQKLISASDYPSSEGFEVAEASANSSSSIRTDSASKEDDSKKCNHYSGPNVGSTVPRGPVPNKVFNNLTLMDNTVANATMSSTLINNSLMSPRSSVGGEALTILVDSKELSSAPHMVSTLTITYGLNPIVSQLQGCDYVISTRMGVEKRTLSEFANGANRQKLLERVRHMCELFDRPCVIIEKDREKNRDKRQPPKTLMRTKYLDSTLAALTKTHVKILFSDSTEETAQILTDLVKIESRKGAAIPPIPDMDSTTEQVLKFYQSIPGVSYVTALSLMHHYSSIAELLSTCESILQSRIKISSIRAKQIMTYINHCFDEQMTGSR